MDAGAGSGVWDGGGAEGGQGAGGTAEAMNGCGWSRCRSVRPGGGAAGAAVPAKRIDFATRVLPVLTKAGCNTGMCHGAAIGQGGFRLSLLGYDPRADYESITREFEGRRLDLGAPDGSLLLRKPSLQSPHGGGLRLKKGSAAYQAVRAWIAAGAPFGSGGIAISRLEVAPRDVLLPAPGRSQQLRVTAVFSDGGREEVTPLALVHLVGRGAGRGQSRGAGYHAGAWGGQPDGAVSGAGGGGEDRGAVWPRGFCGSQGAGEQPGG